VSTALRPLVQAISALLVLALGVLGAIALFQTRPQPVRSEGAALPPLVRALAVARSAVTVTVRTQGTVLPHVDTHLVAQVEGRIVETAPSLAAGGFFAAGDVLARIEDTDHRAAVQAADAALARARLALAREEAEADAARREWREIGEGDPPPLVAREPQLADARAAVRAADAALELAQVNLARTAIRAPFDGRVWEKSIDVGQFVMRGTVVARVYAVDFAEVRLPIGTDELAFVDLPLAYRGEPQAPPGPGVALRASLGGREWSWTGRIVRTEGEVDRRSRMLHAVARVEDPYGRRADGPQDAARPPLPVGLFVSAEIEGRTFGDVVALPRAALRDADRVLIVDRDERLRARRVEVLRRERDRVLVRSGLEPGERVCTSVLDVVTEGMQVRTIEDTGAADPPADGK
jgi:RND family efflux transporter MFP subunit